VLAAGFAKLDAKALAAKEETAITGLLVDQMRSILESRQCPRGCQHLAVHDDRPESSVGVEGKRRPRVDIFVERTGLGPRPRFHFEAKRLNGSDSVAAYLGDDGLGCFLSGKYAKNDPDAGMVGYVQLNEPTDWAKKLSERLASNGWAPLVALASTHPHTFQSKHNRGTQSLEIIHVLLRCH
jgi:hypothetical protein